SKSTKTKSASSAPVGQRGARGGVMAVAKRGRDREPSKASLREIPEVKFDRARVRRNPYAARIVGEAIVVHVGRGRPIKIMEVGGTRPRSVPLPDGVRKKIAAP